MLRRQILLSALDRFREVGPLLFRLFLGFTLIYGTLDNVLHAERMLEFRDFLAENGFPRPLASAYLSAYAQFFSGILILIGLLTRWASIVMIVNFAVAISMVHVGLPFSANISPLAMLFGSVLFLFYGAGPFSADAWLQRTQHSGSLGDPHLGTRRVPHPTRS
jgi:putative oxidoreductase